MSIASIVDDIINGVVPLEAPRQRFDNNLAARLVTNLDAISTSFSIVPVGEGGWPATLLPNEWFELTMSAVDGRFEIVRVIQVISTYSLVVLRGQGNTLPQFWEAARTSVSGRLTADALNDFVREGEVNTFTMPQQFDQPIVMRASGGNPNVVMGGLEFREPGVPGFSLTRSGDTGRLDASAAFTFNSPAFTLNGLGWPAEPSLVRGQHLFAADNDQIIGRPLEWYIGSFTAPPTVLTSGDPLQPGMLYYDLNTLRMKLWTGLTWRDPLVPGPGYLQQLVYITEGTQTEFDLSVPDENGFTFQLDAGAPETVEVHKNGLLLQQDVGFGGDYIVDAPSNTVIMTVAVSPGAKLQISFYVDPSRIAPAGVRVLRVKALAGQNGTNATFQLLRFDTNEPISPTTPQELEVHLDGIRQQPGIDYTVAGDDITFTTPPRADSMVWMLYFDPEVSGGGGGGGIGTITSVNGQTGPIVVLDKDDIGLGNADNTTDLAKPLSTATIAALLNKMDNSPPALVALHNLLIEAQRNTILQSLITISQPLRSDFFKNLMAGIAGPGETIEFDELGNPAGVPIDDIAFATSAADILTGTAEKVLDAKSLHDFTDEFRTVLGIGDVVGSVGWPKVRSLATTNVNLATVTPGTSVGGVSLAAADEFAVVGQSTASQNGPWVVAASGAPTRPVWADIGSELPGLAFFVLEGTQQDTGWLCTTNSPVTLGSTALAFTQIIGQATNANVASLAGLTLAANKGLYSTGVSTLALYDLSAFARTYLDDVDAAATRATLGAQVGHTNLTAFSGLTLVADKAIYANGAGTLATFDLSSYARSVLDDADATTARATLGAQAVHGNLTALAGLSFVADKGIYANGAGTVATFDLSAFARSVLDDINAATARTTLGAQASHTNLSALSGLSIVANKGIYGTGVGTVDLFDLSVFARTYLDDVDAATTRTTLGAQTVHAILTALSGLTLNVGYEIRATAVGSFATIKHAMHPITGVTGSPTFDAANGINQHWTLSGNVTSLNAFTTIANCGVIEGVLIIKQTSSGGGVLTVIPHAAIKLVGPDFAGGWNGPATGAGKETEYGYYLDGGVTYIISRSVRH